MTLLMEKLSRYWQLRFVVVGLGIALIVYAVLLPDPENKSRDSSIQSVAAAPLTRTETSSPSSPAISGVSDSSFSLANSGSAPWMGENREAAGQLQLVAEGDGETSLPVDASESARGLREKAEANDAVAQFLLGHAYEVGLGVPKDMSETARWYALAGETRRSGAAEQQPVKDFAQAFEAYRKLAEQGDANAELYLGLAYDLGQDVPRNVASATRWYRKAAAQGSGSAAGNLGVIYFNGDGVPKDDAEAAEWFRAGANRGSASAEYCLGRLYYMGDGVKRDEAQAAGWLQRAAVQGNAPAQKLLSLMYATAQGVGGSTPMAYMWINLASAKDNDARAAREQIEKVMPSDEVAEGQRLTHEWLAQHGRLSR